MPTSVGEGQAAPAKRAAPHWAVALLATAIASCGQTVASRPADDTAPPSAPPPTPTSAPPATPMSTPSITSEPTTAPSYVTTGLVIHMTNFGDTGSSGPGTTILEDGRIIWTDNSGG